MTGRKSLLALVCAVLAPWLTAAAPGGAVKPAVTWIHHDTPPLFIVNGPMAGRGFYDRIVDEMMKALPGFEHRAAEAPLRDIMAEFKRRTDACVAGLIRTPEREKFALFTPSMVAVLPNGLIVEPGRRAPFDPYRDGSGAVDLGQVVETSDLTIGHVAGRAYSGAIDEVIRRHPDSKRLHARSGENQLLGLLDMMGVGRIDGVVGYAMEIRYLNTLHNRDQGLEVLPVKGMPKLILASIACSKSPVGEAVITAIVPLVDAKLRERFSLYYADWIDNGSAAYFRSLLPHFSATGKAPD